MKTLVFIILFFLFLISTCSAATERITNGGFETGNFAGWTYDYHGGYPQFYVHTNYPQEGTYNVHIVKTFHWNLSQSIDLTNVDNVTFWYQFTAYSSCDTYQYRVFVDSTQVYYCDGWRNPYEQQFANVSLYSGVHTLRINFYSPDEYVSQLDNISALASTSKLYGYVTNNIGNTVSSATITLNNSGGSTTSNDTGYYEITEIPSGTYSITATSPTHQDNSDTVSITADTEKNITMTRLSPVLTWTDAETTMNDVYLKWRRNIVVDNVRIYKDTETRLLTTVASGSTLSGLYSDRNLDCDKGYVYWLQPMDNDVAGPKYRIDAKTDPCDGGGGGGGDPTPTPSPTATPGPTPPPWTNITPEEWLNLTLDQKQEILANMSLFPPLLEFQWEDIYVWGIHLFLILCGAVALDSITIQKVSEYTGLWAILPGVMFAYLTGYLVI